MNDELTTWLTELREYVEAGDIEIALQMIDGHLALLERQKEGLDSEESVLQ